MTDSFSTALSFEGWTDAIATSASPGDNAPCRPPPRTWLPGRGSLRGGGPLSTEEAPPLSPNVRLLVAILADPRSRQLQRVVVRSSHSSFEFDREARRLEVRANTLPREGAEITEVIVGLAAHDLLSFADVKAKAALPALISVPGITVTVGT